MPAAWLSMMGQSPQAPQYGQHHFASGSGTQGQRAPAVFDTFVPNMNELREASRSHSPVEQTTNSIYSQPFSRQSMSLNSLGQIRENEVTMQFQDPLQNDPARSNTYMYNSGRQEQTALPSLSNQHAFNFQRRMSAPALNNHILDYAPAMTRNSAGVMSDSFTGKSVSFSIILS